MSIFGNDGNNYGSLGMGAPDTGRGDAFDQMAASRGYPKSPGGTPVKLGQPRPRPIPPGGFAQVEFGTPRPVPIPPGGFVDVTALQGGMGAPARHLTTGNRRASVAPMGFLTIKNPLRVPVRVWIKDNRDRLYSPASGDLIGAQSSRTFRLRVGYYGVEYKPDATLGAQVRAGRPLRITLMS